jgi:hypothetical protein
MFSSQKNQVKSKIESFLPNNAQAFQQKPVQLTNRMFDNFAFLFLASRKLDFFVPCRLTDLIQDIVGAPGRPAFLPRFPFPLLTMAIFLYSFPQKASASLMGWHVGNTLCISRVNSREYRSWIREQCEYNETELHR